SGADAASAAYRTQRLRHSARPRILRRAQTERAFSSRPPIALIPTPYSLIPSPSLHRHDPVPPHVEGELLVEPIDERRAVLIEERDEPDRPFLRVAAGERQHPRVHELTAQRLVAPLGRLNHLAVQRLQIVLHASERRSRRALERRIERRHRLND